MRISGIETSSVIFSKRKKLKNNAPNVPKKLKPKGMV